MASLTLCLNDDDDDDDTTPHHTTTHAPSQLHTTVSGVCVEKKARPIPAYARQRIRGCDWLARRGRIDECGERYRREIEIDAKADHTIPDQRSAAHVRPSAPVAVGVLQTPLSGITTALGTSESD